MEVMKLLVADDEPLERQAVRIIVERSGAPFRVVGEARNGSEALRLCREESPDIVLMDIKMPGIDGLSAAREIKREFPEKQVIVLTAYDEFEYAKEALKLGASDYILKPAHASEILAVLDRVRESIVRDRSRREEEQKIKDQMAEVIPSLKNNFVMEIIFGLLKDEEAAVNRGQLIGLKTLPQVAFAVSMEPFDGGVLDVWTEVERYRVQRIVDQTLEEYPEGLCMLLSEHMVIGLWGPLGGNGDSLNELVAKIVARARDELNVRVTVGVGRAYKEFSRLHRSVWEAQTAAYLGMFYLGPERVVSINEVEILQTGPRVYPFDKENELVESLKVGDKARAEETFRLLLERTSGTLHSEAGLIKARLAKVLVLVAHSFSRSGFMSPELFDDYNELFQRLSLCGSIEELRVWLGILAEKASSWSRFRVAGTGSSVVDGAIEYIHNNYQRDISLADLAKIIFLNPDYFSRVFKQCTGRTFSEYLTQVRIDRAKELLSETDLPVGELAREVGYSDPNYFSRVFARVTGMCPSRYRQMARAKIAVGNGEEE